LLWNARGVAGGDTEGSPKCFVGVYHQLLARQWHIRGKARSRLDCGGEFHVSPPLFKRHVHDSSVLLALNGYMSGVIDILIGSVCHIGWRIVGRQAIWWEGMLVLNLRIMGAARTSQIFAYHS